MVQGKITKRFVKIYRCWYITNYGWICFDRKFKNKKHALRYCENRTTYKGTSIVELLHNAM